MRKVIVSERGELREEKKIKNRLDAESKLLTLSDGSSEGVAYSDNCVEWRGESEICFGHVSAR